MPSQAAVAAEPAEIREKIIIALDVPAVSEARRVVHELAGSVGAFKVGMQLFTAGGPEFVRELTSAGHRVFLDLKFHDIPNTVAHAGVEAARLGVWMFNVHASGGREMMTRTAEAVTEYAAVERAPKPHLIAVTVLTSSDRAVLQDVGVPCDVDDQVARLAGLSYDSGLDGVVSSPKEVAIVRRSVPDAAFLTVTPGIRPSDATSDDQRRVTTISEALTLGSNYVVVGRPVVQTRDRAAAVESLVLEASGLS